MGRIALLFGAASLAAFAYACGDDGGSTGGTSDLSLEFMDLPELGAGVRLRGLADHT